jgi:hypothetical protein
MPDLVDVAPAQCRLQYDSTTAISLQRYAGKYIPLKIGGTWGAKEIPEAGVSLANTGLTADTAYYIYAYDNSGTLTLEASTTTPAADSDTGLQVKTGDATRLLVGAVHLGSGTPGTFVETTAAKQVASFYNRRRRSARAAFTANRTRANTAYGEVNSEIRVSAWVWGDNAPFIMLSGNHANGTAGQATHTAVTRDSDTTNFVGHTFIDTGINGATHNCGIAKLDPGATVGKHFWTVAGKTTGAPSTGTWSGGADDGARTILEVAVNI